MGMAWWASWADEAGHILEDLSVPHGKEKGIILTSWQGLIALKRIISDL
jgi:hypothetical protein